MTAAVVPPMPVLLEGEQLLCTVCFEPIDPVVWPQHPSHAITDEQWAMLARAEEDAAAKAQAVQEAALRAEHARLVRAAKKQRGKKAGR